MKGKKKPLYKRVWFWLLIVFVGLPMAVAVITEIPKTEEAAPPVEEQAEAEKPRELTAEEKAAAAAQQRKALIEKQFSDWDGSHRALTKYIKKNMHDPKTYKHVETRYRDDGDFVTVQAKFRGTNAFGGLVMNTVVAKCSIGGQVLEIISQE